ncbi:MAG: hypothetical protein COU09_01725 [Candidatus Harrisonbacteria bacterium CG10_big_fil_rev_8_21_14_0_10_44_23]|uniref:Carbohydrate kinase PfkB domain-containing protein n=1 Tax=Candidatus Harrisonbacteria bacterium CG10_big_fil_rev_8_21_14_0_10_44_23 TaxID=1974585 RepID=A0A2H0UQ79_9BACT|nr:MAG: hypothetical protein COU09_01725 [Candidatus Harrisonbacteria bacterium CG10_big_fil_rev_8_21_14_0_10_44_23]
MKNINFDVITIGTATKDVFLFSPLFRVLKDEEHLKKIGFPEGRAECFAFGGKIDVEKAIFSTGGGAGNAATTFARQGYKTATIISVGEDPQGEEIVGALEKEGVSVFASKHKKKTSAFSTLLLTESGERTVLVARGAANALDLGQVSLRDLNAKWVYVNPGAIDFTTIEKAVMTFKKKGAKLAINPSTNYLKMPKAKIVKLLKKFDVIILNREEAVMLTKQPHDDERKIFRAFENISSGIIVMTDGPDGALVSDHKFIYRAGIFKDSGVKDRTGAGDAFGSGFVASLAREESVSEPIIKEAIRMASANSTAVVEQVGARDGILSYSSYQRSKHFKRLPVRKIFL